MNLHAAARMELMDALYQEHHIPPIGENEFTVNMLATQYGISDQQARRIVDEAVTAGKIEAAGERMVGNKRKATAYRARNE